MNPHRTASRNQAGRDFASDFLLLHSGRLRASTLRSEALAALRYGAKNRSPLGRSTSTGVPALTFMPESTTTFTRHPAIA